MSRSGAGRISVFDKNHGAERIFQISYGADIGMWGKSRIVTVRISTGTDYCGADIRLTDFFTERIASLREIIRRNRGISHGAPWQ